MTVTKNLNKKNDAQIIATGYNLMPGDEMKFEMSYTQTSESFAFFCNKSNSTKCHIRFDSDQLESP